MGKGQAWVNGNHIGRYWSAYHSPSTGCSKTCDYRGTYDSWKCLNKCGEPAQIWYHVPRTWLHPGENLLVLHEELGGDPTKIDVLEINRQVICSHVAENDPTPVGSWTKDGGFTTQLPEVHLQCDKGWYIAEIQFAKFGTIGGDCGEFVPGGCHSDLISNIHQDCVGKEGCRIPVSIANLGDPCPGMLKSLAVQGVCSA